MGQAVDPLPTSLTDLRGLTTNSIPLAVVQAASKAIQRAASQTDNLEVASLTRIRCDVPCLPLQWRIELGQEYNATAWLETGSWPYLVVATSPPTPSNNTV